MVYRDVVVLLDRDAVNAWDGNGYPIGTTDLPSSTNSQMTSDGDMTPWRIRLSLTNTGANGETNSGSIKLRIDEKKTFLQSGPKLLSSEAREKYLIEAYIIQDDENGNPVESKRYRFQLGSPMIDTSKEMGTIMTISLQEIQYRLKESVSSREIRFKTPKQALNSRIIDFNNHQVNGINILIDDTTNLLPDVENLQQNYLPQGARPIQSLIELIFDRLEEPQTTGGVFKDFYFDFDPTISTKTTKITADEIGRTSTGIVLNPLNARAIDSEQEQTVFTDFVRYKNNVIVRGNPNSGTLPPDHSIYASKWLHAKYRNEWRSDKISTDRGNNDWNYLKGATVKINYNTGITTNPVISRYFLAIQDVPIGTGSPDVNPTYWEEDFITIPEFSVFGSYEENDIVYQYVSGQYKFYRAKENIFAFTLNGYRRGKNNTDPLWGSFLTAGGLLKLPSSDSTHWEDMSGSIPAHSSSNFAGYQSYSPWTQNIFAWEKNMVGLKSGSLIEGENGNSKFVGLVPDWNMCRDLYQKQKAGDEFSNITYKWVYQIEVNDPSSLPDEQIYHGQRVLVGSTPAGKFITDYDQQFTSGNSANRVAQYSIKREIWDNVLKKYKTSAGWIFSDSPSSNDIIFNFDDGQVYVWDGSWKSNWRYWYNPKQIGMPCHPVKDVYKVKGFEGTPNSAIEFRYLVNTEELINDFVGLGDANRRERLSRLASRGAWLWFWNPFPRQPSGEASIDVGDLYGGNPVSAQGIVTGFTTLNINNNNSDRFQDLKGWNNGLKSEDMGRISGLSFKLKVGLFSDEISIHNDLEFRELGNTVDGLKKIDMIFWAIDDFQRIWYYKFELRMNNVWENVVIPFGDSSKMNLYTAPFDSFTYLFGFPELVYSFSKKEKEYTSVQFDWEFVRGWGIMYADSYEPDGRYTAGLDASGDARQSNLTTLENTPTDTLAQITGGIEYLADYLTSIGQTQQSADEIAKRDAIIEEANKLLEKRTYSHEQYTIAIDDLHYIKELTANSDDSIVNDARTIVESASNEFDYINLKLFAKTRKVRHSFYPQFWSFRGVGDVRMRIGKKFNIVGSRIPDYPEQYPDWNIGQTYLVGQKIKFTDDYAYVCLTNTSAGESPTTNPEKWDNLNELVCASVTHIIDGTGYNMEVEGRKRFVVG